MARVHEDFHLGCLALVLAEQRPFQADVQLPPPVANIVLPANWLNSLRPDQLHEYECALLRHLLNDLVLAYERYGMTMLLSHECDGVLTEPAEAGTRELNASGFEKLDGVFSEPDLSFLSQLRHLRNTVVHYNGLYNKCNLLDYTFGTQRCSSRGNEGKPIEFNDYAVVLWIWGQLGSVVARADRNYFSKDWHPMKSPL